MATLNPGKSADVKVHRVDPGRPSPAAIEEAASVIRRGGLVAFPTETVYGLGANALDRAAVMRIFSAKGRPSYNPLIVHTMDTAMARSLAGEWPETAERLAAAYWPGPLTLVVRKSVKIPDEVTAGLATVALRVPSHPVARELLAAAEVPIAAPSANRFTELSPTAAAHVVKGLSEEVDLLLDGGRAAVGIESTVLDLSGPAPVLLRPGAIDAKQLEAVLERSIVLPDVYGEAAGRPSPGMFDRHYAPRAKLRVVAAGDVARLTSEAEEASRRGARVGALLRELDAVRSLERAVRMPFGPADYARSLYGALHALDDEGIDLVLVEEVPSGAAWAAVRDRLNRAMG